VEHESLAVIESGSASLGIWCDWPRGADLSLQPFEVNPPEPAAAGSEPKADRFV